MINFKKTTRVSVCCFHADQEELWLNELKTVGIPIHKAQIKGEKIYSGRNGVLLLIQPSYELYGAEYIQRAKFNSADAEDYLFVVSKDERWKELNEFSNFFYIPAQTHPLEVARLLVEKLDLALYSNKTQYAFSIFSF